MRGIKPEKKMDANGRPIDDYWLASLKMLGDMKFLDALKEYDKDNIPPAVMKRIREKFINSPAFDPAIIKNVSSKACEGFVKWIKAMEVYDGLGL
jgi:dynein heavy chain